jgi:DNA-binding CsgD family transcriptional regulator
MTQDEAKMRMALLTPQQRLCVIWIGKGETYEGTAAKMGITKKTVECHMNNARETLGCNTVRLCVTATLAGMVQ